jgi:hypothetical protein
MSTPLTGSRPAGYRGPHMTPGPDIVDDLCRQCGSVVGYGIDHELVDCLAALHRRVRDLEEKYTTLARVWAYER